MIWYVKVIVAMALLLWAIYTDIKRNKIENRLLAAGLVTGILLVYLEGGGLGILDGVKRCFGVILVLFPFFLLKGLGAGDIKLLGVMAVFFPKEIISIIFLSFFIGAVIGIGKMVVRGLQKQKMYCKRETLHFSIPIALGVSMAILIGRIG